MLTIASIFSGGCGAEAGARAAGLKPIWGIEIDDRISEVARTNGFDVTTADVLDIDVKKLEPPDVFHASPVCKSASVANANRGEKDWDTRCGSKVAEFIKALRPKFVTIENVWGYRKFDAFKLICDTLDECKYVWDVTHVNAADYGVPQTRKRLILRATRYGRKALPPLPVKERWVGWYEAISDLIPTLPESKFAPWQLKRLPKELLDTCFVDTTGNTSRDITVRELDEPITTVGAGWMRRPQNVPCAFLTDCLNYSSTNPNRAAIYPAMTIVVHSPKHPAPLAFIINAREMHDHREENPVTLRQGDEPVFTLSATSGVARSKAWLQQGRVVKMTTRALARFQSFPDTYVLPENMALACQVIGNAVPPLLYEKLIRSLCAGYLGR